jgi:hypothetical protein
MQVWVPMSLSAFSGRAGKPRLKKPYNEEGSPHGKEKNRIEEKGTGKEKGPDQEQDPDEEKGRDKIYWSGYQNTPERTGHSH